jgi:hypothetical protein
MSMLFEKAYEEVTAELIRRIDPPIGAGLVCRDDTGWGELR